MPRAGRGFYTLLKLFFILRSQVKLNNLQNRSHRVKKCTALDNQMAYKLLMGSDGQKVDKPLDECSVF